MIYSRSVFIHKVAKGAIPIYSSDRRRDGCDFVGEGRLLNQKLENLVEIFQSLHPKQRYNGFSERFVRIFVAAQGLVDHSNCVGVAPDRCIARFRRRIFRRPIHLHLVLNGGSCQFSGTVAQEK